MEREFKNYEMLSAGKVLAIESSTDASPIVVTITGHGFSTGDKVTVFGHETNVAANGSWVITKVTDDTFSLNGSVGSGAGAGINTGITADFVEPILVKDWRHLIISIASDGGGTADATIKCVGSIKDTVPDFSAPRTVDNHFEFIQMIDKQASGSGLNGDTGVVFSGADDYRQFEVNTNGLNWLSFLPISGTAGQYTIKALVLNP
jgi:hypothetical protein